MQLGFSIDLEIGKKKKTEAAKKPDEPDAPGIVKKMLVDWGWLTIVTKHESSVDQPR